MQQRRWGSVYGSAETFEYGDLAAKMEWLEKACANDNAKGCIRLSFMYYEGKNVETNFEKALKYHQKACDGNSQLCSDIE